MTRHIRSAGSSGIMSGTKPAGDHPRVVTNRRAISDSQRRTGGGGLSPKVSVCASMLPWYVNPRLAFDPRRERPRDAEIRAKGVNSPDSASSAAPAGGEGLGVTPVSQRGQETREIPREASAAHVDAFLSTFEFSITAGEGREDTSRAGAGSLEIGRLEIKNSVTGNPRIRREIPVPTSLRIRVRET